MVTLSAQERFELAVDPAAQGWLVRHPEAARLLINFTSTRCCSGTPVREVRIRVEPATSERRARDARWLLLGEAGGREVLLDARLAKLMPRQVPLTARGVGPFRHLDLDLTSEQWADLLYPVPG